MLSDSKVISSFAARSFGIIGGGAVLFSATALAGQAVQPLLGETYTGVGGSKLLRTMFINKYIPQ